MKKTKTVLPSTYLKATSVTAAVLTALYGAPAHADADADADSGIGISEVTVTATRRVTTAQDIPLSITAVSGATLEKEGIQDIAGLAHSMGDGHAPAFASTMEPVGVKRGNSPRVDHCT